MKVVSTTALAGMQWDVPSRGTVGMYCVIAAESAIFTIFVIAYLFYAGKSVDGPQPREVLHFPLFLTACLLASSLTVHLAVKSLQSGHSRSFGLWWMLTIACGAVFLIGTLREWLRLIYVEGLTIRTSLFGTTYYSLVGLHAFHVAVGVLCLALVALFLLQGSLRQEHAERLEVLSLYWHFVDAVWLVVVVVVYVVAR